MQALLYIFKLLLTQKSEQILSVLLSELWQSEFMHITTTQIRK